MAEIEPTAASIEGTWAFESISAEYPKNISSQDRQEVEDILKEVNKLSCNKAVQYIFIQSKPITTKYTIQCAQNDFFIGDAIDFEDNDWEVKEKMLLMSYRGSFYIQYEIRFLTRQKLVLAYQEDPQSATGILNFRRE